MKFGFKKKAEQAQAEREQVTEALTEDVLGQIWGGNALKECCHTDECAHRGNIEIAAV